MKETIDLLTRVLRGNGTSKIKAEIFRLAKFDKDEAVRTSNSNEPPREKPRLWGFRPGPTQTGMCCRRR